MNFNLDKFQLICLFFLEFFFLSFKLLINFLKKEKEKNISFLFFTSKPFNKAY
jgi:hypothetical protein